ncbi:MAG: hypothetical protein HOQ05_11125 [Corynebacteriales bacterium]|nr:hypothetical protein [Mycobacteriales bacterium]
MTVPSVPPAPEPPESAPTTAPAVPNTEPRSLPVPSGFAQLPSPFGSDHSEAPLVRAAGDDPLDALLSPSGALEPEDPGEKSQPAEHHEDAPAGEDAEKPPGPAAGGVGSGGGSDGPGGPATPAAPDGDDDPDEPGGRDSEQEPAFTPSAAPSEPPSDAIDRVPAWQVELLRTAIERAATPEEPDTLPGQPSNVKDEHAPPGSEQNSPSSDPETQTDVETPIDLPSQPGSEGGPPPEVDAADFDELAFLERPGALADAALDSAPLLVLVPRLSENGVVFGAQPVMPGELETEIARDGLDGLHAQSEVDESLTVHADEFLLQQRALRSRAEAALRVDALDGYYNTLVQMGRAVEGTIPASEMARALSECLDELGERGVAPLTVARSAGERIDAAMSGLVVEILGATQPNIKPDATALAELSREYARLAEHATACAARLAEHDDSFERATRLANFIAESSDIVREASQAGAALAALPEELTTNIASAAATLTDEQRAELATIDSGVALADFVRRAGGDATALIASLDDVGQRASAIARAHEALSARFFPTEDPADEEPTPTNFSHIAGDTAETFIAAARAGTLSVPDPPEPEPTGQSEIPEPVPEPAVEWYPPIDLSAGIVGRRDVHIPALEKDEDGLARFVVDTLSLPVSDNPLAKIDDIEQQAREGLDRARARERALNGFRLAEDSDAPDTVELHRNTAVVRVSDASSGSTIDFAEEQVRRYEELVKNVEDFKERTAESDELDPRGVDVGLAQVMGSVAGIQDRAFFHRRASDGFEELQSQMDERLWGSAKEDPSCELFQTNQSLFRIDLETRIDMLSEPLYDTRSDADPTDRRRQVVAGLIDLKERVAAVHTATRGVAEGQSAFFVAGAMLEDIDNLCDELTEADSPKFGPGEVEGISERLDELKSLNPFWNGRLPEQNLVDLTSATPAPPVPPDRWPGFHQPFEPPRQGPPLKLDLPLERGFDRIDLPELRLGGTDTQLASDLRVLLNRLEQAAMAVDTDTISENALRRDRGETVPEPGSFVEEVQAARQRLEPQLVAPTPEKMRQVLREVDQLLTEAVLRPTNAHPDVRQLYPLRDSLANSRTGADSNPLSAAIYVRLLGAAFDVKLGEATRQISAMVQKLEVGNPATWQELDGFVRDQAELNTLLKLANVAQEAARDLPEARQRLLRTHRLVQSAGIAVGQARQRAADEADAQVDVPRAPTEMSMARLRFALDRLRDIVATPKWPDVDTWTLDAIYEHCRPDDPGRPGAGPPQPGRGPSPHTPPPPTRPYGK